MPIDVEGRARDLAEKMANFVYFDCDALHDGPYSLDATYVRYTAAILALVRAAVEEERGRVRLHGHAPHPHDYSDMETVDEVIHALVYHCGVACLNREHTGLCAEKSCDDCDGPTLAAEAISKINTIRSGGAK